MYIGTKFNMRKETVLNEKYLGVYIYRFYFKCTRCYSEITMKTDPKNAGYICEFGA
jgi:Saf4/Yju2 protein